jgi:hypothetical protein
MRRAAWKDAGMVTTVTSGTTLLDAIMNFSTCPPPHGAGGAEGDQALCPLADIQGAAVQRDYRRHQRADVVA